MSMSSLLRKKFPSLSSLGSDGNTSFLRAARAGNLDKVLEHLKNNIDINTSNANGLNALHLASKDGHVHVVSELLKRGAIVDSATKKGNTALHIASLAGQEDVVKLLLQHNASVNVQSQNGFTPLYMAAQENHDSVVKLLLANGANQSLATEDGFTPLAVAMQQGHDKVVAVLLESDTRGKVRLPALHIAAKKDDVKAATLLLENDHNPDVTSKSGFTPLHIASHYGNEAIANLLIQKGADVNYAAKHNITPLHVAAKWGKTNMVSLLLEKGANIESKTRDGLTPLHCAARSGHEQVVDMLLERGAPISAKTKNGLAPLHMAAQGEHVDAARILLYHRAPVDEVTVDYLTALHVAAHCGHVRVAKLLLDRNADANARALNGFTPLHIACKKNRIKVVELLLRHGASISATTESGLTPLHVASFMGCMNIVIYLLQHDASPDVPTVRGETPLHLAARANQTDIIRILLRNGAQVDARAREQQTPLHIASRLGNVDIVMLLLQHGAQVDATTKDMYTALHIAAKEGQDEVAAVLIENGASLDATTKKGFTPLHLTAKYGHMKVAQLLLQKDAPVDAQGKNGVTPLHVASHYDHQNVALLLLEKGASPHATAKNGHTPLHIAARKNQMDIATTLLEYGAHADAESKAGFTPLHLSAQEGHTDMSALLLEHKAECDHQARNGLTPLHLCAQEDKVNVAQVLVKNGANIEMATKAGYTPLHVASHFGQANMVRYLLQNGANVDAATGIGYTPLHQAAQQGHCHIVNLLLEHKANANAQTASGQTPLHIARKLGYISVLDSLKSITNESTSPTQPLDEKYRVVAPEAMHETFMSDSEEEGGEDTVLSDQPYRYLTVDEMKSLGDDSLPIDVTRDERMDSNRMVQSADSTTGQPPVIIEGVISPQHAQIHMTSKTVPDGPYIADNVIVDKHPQHVGRKLQWKNFLVSFLVDARGGAMRGCRHSGVRIIVPARSASQPTRITCRYVKPQRTMHPPQLMEGEALASRVLEIGPVSTKFLGPVVMEVPHFASLRGKEREIVILRSDNGETWREHTIENSDEIVHDVLNECFEPEEINQLDELGGGRICRFVTYDFPQYFAVVSRIRQEVHAIGPEGGMVSSTVVPQVQAVFPQGALTKKIKVGLQAQPIDPDLTAKLLGRGVAVSPIVTVEPRRRKFHKAITLSMPAPKAHSQGMINQYSGNAPTLRLLCSITGGPSRAQWEDVTGSTPLTFVNDCVSFTTTVSARFWLMDCRNISEATKMATELYREAIHVPFMAKFVVFAKRVEQNEARLRVFCMTDDKEDKTLEQQEHFTEVAKSRDVEVLEAKSQYIEMAGNLVPVTKSGEQLQLTFRAFRENRLPFSVRIKDQHADTVGRTLFMREPKVAKGEPPQQPICILNIVLPEKIIPDQISLSDSREILSKMDISIISKRPEDYYLGDMRIVDISNMLGEDWITLAPEIGITQAEISTIEAQHPTSTAQQAQSMIRLFKLKKSNDLNVLENGLRVIGRNDIIQKCIKMTSYIETSRHELSKHINLDNAYETDIMKDSESVEELVMQEDQKRRERDEIKYSAEEKAIEESESDDENVKRSVAERRHKIEKRLSLERAIPASTQKKEIVQEITEIKRKSLIEDKKAIHEEEIMLQMPTDNIIKSAVVPEHIIKLKTNKIETPDVSKTDFDKELQDKFKKTVKMQGDEEDVLEETSKIVFDSTVTEKAIKVDPRTGKTVEELTEIRQVEYSEIIPETVKKFEEAKLDLTGKETVKTVTETVTEVLDKDKKVTTETRTIKETVSKEEKKETSKVKTETKEVIDPDLERKLSIQKGKIEMSEKGEKRKSMEEDVPPVVKAPKKEELKKGDQKKEEPKKKEPKKDETKKVELKKVEPRKVEPKKIEPKKVEPKKIEPKKTEPKKAEPKKEDSTKAKLKKDEPKIATKTQDQKQVKGKEQPKVEIKEVKTESKTELSKTEESKKSVETAVKTEIEFQKEESKKFIELEKEQINDIPRMLIDEDNTAIEDYVPKSYHEKPRESLTEEEFYKSVEATITKKMSEGLIEITQDILSSVSKEIPDSQTPPPTPNEAQSHKDGRYDSPGSIMEEITGGTKVDFEGQPTIFEPEEGDNIDYIRYEAAILIDSILEQSIMIVNAQQCNDYNSESEQYAITCDVNGIDMVKSPTIESLSGKSFDDNMSINDDNNIVNIPPLTTTTTTEIITTTSSSVDENNDNYSKINFCNDQNIMNDKPNEENVDCERNRSEKNFDRIERKFERLSSQLDDLEESAIRFDTDFDNMLSKDDVSNLQSDFSKISWDESVSGTTTAADVGLSTPDNDLQDLPTEPSGDTARSETDIPKPTPRISKTLPSDIIQVQEEIIKKSEKESKIPVKIVTKTVEAVVKDVDFKQSKKFWESLESSGQIETQLMPVPKPRSAQFKISDTTTIKSGEEPIVTPLIKLAKADDTTSVASAKSSSQDSKNISSEQQVEYSETSSIHTSLEDDKHKEDDSVMSDDRIEDETYPDLDKLDKKSFDEDDTGLKTITQHDEESIGEKQASFYIGESSMNIITKSSTDKRNEFAFDNEGYEGTFEEDRDSELKDKREDITSESLPSDHQEGKVFVPVTVIPIDDLQKQDIKIERLPQLEQISGKIYETEILSMEQEKSPTRIFRQDSETRNDILECETFLEREKTYSKERDSADLKKESVESIEDIVEESSQSESPLTNLLCKFIEEEQSASSRILRYEAEKSTSIKPEDIRLEEIVAQFSYAETVPIAAHKKEEKDISEKKSDGASSIPQKTKFEEMKTETKEKHHEEIKASSSSKTEQILHEATLKDHKKHIIEHVYFEEQVTPILQEAVKEEIPTHIIGIVESQVLKEHSEQKKVEEKSKITTKQMYSAAEIVESKKFEEIDEHEIRLEAKEVREEKSKLDKGKISQTTVETDFSKTVKQDEINKTHTDFTEVKKSEETHKVTHKTEEKFKEISKDEKFEEVSKSDQKAKFEPKLDLNLDKSELELSEKSFSKTSKYEESSSGTDQKPVLSPVKGFKGFASYQESKERFKKTLLIEPSQVDQTMVEQTIEEVKESLDAVQEELIEVVKDGKLIKESPSEFEFKLLPHIKCTTDTIQESFHEETSSGTISDPSKDSSKPETSEDKQKPTEVTDTSKVEDVTSLSSTDDASKPEVVHRVRKEMKTDTLNRWSIPDLDHSSSGDTSSQYQSFEKTDSRPLSSDVENLLHSSEYQTALDASLLPESTEYVSAVSTLDHSGKTISSRESMKSLDSESSANLGSIEISELSETLVPSTAEGDADDDFDADDSDKFCGVLMEEFKKDDEPITSQMKRSQEMTFKQEESIEQARSATESPEITKEDEDFQLYPRLGTSIEDSRLEETKFPSSFEDGSILSMSLSSASNVDTVIENVEDLASSLGASSLAGIDMNVFIRDDYTGTSFEELSKTEKIDNMVMTTSTGKEEDDTNYASTQITTTVAAPLDESSEFEPKRKGHKRNESTAFVATEFLKGIEATKAKGTDSSFEEEEEIKEITQSKEEKKESESESDYDQYESEYSRAYKTPSTQKKSKEKGMETFEKEQEPEKRPFTPSQSVSEPIIEDASEEMIEPMEDYERRPSQNMHDYSNIPDITITEDLKKYTEDGEEIPDEPIEEEDFKDKVLYKVKTQEELHKAEDVPLHYAKEQEYSVKEDQLQELMQRKYESKVADITTKYSVDEEEDEKADSPDSFEMLEQPDISDEFVIIEEVAKEADEFDTEGKGISIKNVKYVQKHDEEVEKILVKSAPAAPNEGSILYREEMNFDFEESPPTGQEQEGENPDAAAMNKRWVEMQLSDNASHLRYPYEIGGGILEDIKEEDTEFEVGSSRISSFKDSFSSTPEYDVLAGRKYFTREHDNASMSSLQEFESLEQAISLENRRLHQGHQGSQDSLSNGSFNRRYTQRSGAQGDDISLSSLTDFEGLENACIEAHLIEIKAKEEAALLLSRSDESSKSNTSNGDTKSSTKTVTTVTTVAQVQSTSSEKSFPKTPQEIEALIKSKLEECEEESSNIMEVSTDSLELGMKKSKSSNGDGIDKKSSELGSCDSLEINKSTDIMTSSIDSFEISKDITARSSRSDVDSLEQQILQDVRRDSVDSIELEQALRLRKTETEHHTSVDPTKDQKMTSVTTSTVITQGPIQTVTRTITTTTSATTSGQEEQQKELIKDISSDSLNLKTDPEQLLTSTESLDHTSSTATNATYQNENDSLMSGSMTSCGSNTLIDTLDSNFSEIYQGGTSSSQFLYEETRSQTRTHSRDGEKRYEYFEIFEKDLDKLDTTKPKSGGDASPELKREEQKK